MTDQLSHSAPAGAPKATAITSRWRMIICCIPMLLIALALVITGVAGPGLIVAAVGSTAMMALMMRGMASMDHEERDQ